MGFKAGLHHDIPEFVFKLIEQLHLDIRMPFVLKSAVAVPLNDESKINLILSVARNDWNHNMNVERVSPILENFHYQLLKQRTCSTVHQNGTKCGGTDFDFEVECAFRLDVSRGLPAGFKHGEIPSILYLMKSTLGKF